MGWRPCEVRAHSYPEFMAAVDGFLGFHAADSGGGGSVAPMTRGELSELMERFPD